MKYKLKENFSTDPSRALEEILAQRGVVDIFSFCHPTEACELSPYGLENINEGAEMLLRHLRRDSKILFIVDCD